MRDDIVPLLDRHLEAFRGKAFVYGQSDCVQFVCQWLKACGVHVTVPVYSSLEEGEALLAAMGFADWTEAVGRFLAPREPLRARAGDVVAHRANGALGICGGGTKAAFLFPDDGIRLASLAGCDKAWSVEPCLS